MEPLINVSAYRFAPLADLGPKRGRLLNLCREWRLRGTILLSPEGINLFVAGPRQEIHLLLAELRSWPGLEDLETKLSHSEYQPFNRMLVRIKKEIIAFGVEGIEPGRHSTPKIPPQKLKAWLDEGKPLLLLDTRNDYEIKLGTFKNAKTLGIKHFREFPNAVREQPAEMKDQPIVMFCTGGIRCEKAGLFMEREGFRNVMQLDGGILRYFEECGGAHYDGQCFVFDQRVGVDSELRETDAAQCFACLSPLTAADQADARYVAGISCPKCFRTPADLMIENIALRHEAIRAASNPLPGSVPQDQYLPITVPGECDGWSLLDTFSRIVRSPSREFWIEQFELGRILNQRREAVAPHSKVRAGEYYFRNIPSVTEPDVDAGVRILHEDEALIVVDKPAPLPMHAGGRFSRNTLEYFLHAAYSPERPRPAHRLDANTTGVVVFTRTRFFASRLQPQFAQGEVRKTYIVKVRGMVTDNEFSCDAPIAAEPGEMGTRRVDLDQGLSAKTQFRLIRVNSDGTTLLEARPLTGRTNQIRIHLWHLGLPVCGDPAYGPDRAQHTVPTLSMGSPPLCLHSLRIAFKHPTSHRDVEYSAGWPTWAGPSL